MRRRVVVPDTSVIVAGLFNETHTRAAAKLLDAIERKVVTAFALHALICEFLSTAAAKRSRRQGSPNVDEQFVEAAVERFFSVSEITYVRESEIQDVAWRLMREAAISPPGSWMLACAISIPAAELWVTHEHLDGFVAAARRHHDRVFTLAANARELP